MSIKLRSTELSSAEASFLKWQYGFDEEDEPFERALWQAIVRAWEADNASGADTRHLERLGCSGAFPEEVELYLRFKSEGSDEVLERIDPPCRPVRSPHRQSRYGDQSPSQQ